MTTTSPFLDFERPYADVIQQQMASDPTDTRETARLRLKSYKILKTIYAKLTPWQKVQVARHPDRPKFQDYRAALITDFEPLAGDRLFAEDQAIIGGLGRFHGQSVVVLGQEKGHDTDSRLRHNFGMAKPEGYRKAIRLIELADQFNLPVLSFVDTAGAYAGIDAEERGQAQAIAAAIDVCLRARVPIISTIIGEGGSGGAVAIATANTVLMLEHAIYSVISPEGCASILWRTKDKAPKAADALKLTAQDLLKLGVIDEVIIEPIGGAHRNHRRIFHHTGATIEGHLTRLMALSRDEIHAHRHKKFLEMGI